MISPLASRYRFSAHKQSVRGSALITALIFAIIITITVISSIRLSTNSLKLAHRTFFADVANNLAETGLEEAVWSFNTLGNSTGSTAIAAAWSVSGRAWTLGNSVSDIYMESFGTGYTSVPTVAVSGGGGSGATASASLYQWSQYVSGVLTTYNGVKVTLVNPGTGYTTAPSVTLSGGGGSGATPRARRSATRTFNFADLGQNATGVVKVWVDGFDGTAIQPIVVAKATITPFEGPRIEKIVKVILSKNGSLPKIGVVAKNGINWNGHPSANSFLSSASPGVPPFSLYNPATSRANTTVASLYGPVVDLSHGTVSGSVMLGPGVTVTGGTITGQQIGNFSYNFAMPTYPVNTGSESGVDLGATLPAVLPRAAEVAANPSATTYYYYVHGATIGATTITAGKNVVIVGNSNTTMAGGFQVAVSGSQVGSAKIYIDGPVNPGNSDINTSSWAGALQVWTSTTADCTVSGNGSIYMCLFAPFSEMVGNGGGNDTVDLCGSFVVGSVRSNGHMSFHWDENLQATVNPRPWGLSLWTELQTPAERALYSTQLNF